MILWSWKFWSNDDNEKTETKAFSDFLYNSKNKNSLQDLLKKKEFRDLKLSKKKNSSITKMYDYTFTDHRSRFNLSNSNNFFVNTEKGIFSKKNNGIPRQFYNYPDGTPLVNNSYLKKNYLGKASMTFQESVEVTHLMERRRQLMEWYGSYNFNEVLQYHLLKREIPLYKKEYPISSYIFSKIRSTALLFGDEFYWDNIITHYLMYTRRGIIRVRANLVEDRQWSQPWSVFSKSKKMKWARWDKVKLKRIYYRLKETELFRINRKTRLLMDKHWTYNDPYHYRYSWTYPPEGFIFEHKRLYHRDIWYFQSHDVFAALNEIRKFKRVKRHKRRVEKSWHYLYDKRITLKEKFLKFVKGDLWLQTKFDTGTLNFTWGDVDKDIQAYNDSFISGQFNLYTHFVTPRWWKQRYNPHIAKFHKFAKLDRYWKWIKPKCYGNRVFLEDYFGPWLHFLAIHKQNPWGSQEKPDTFWFRYSHSEHTYFKQANGQKINASYFGEGSPLARRFEYTYLRVWNAFWEDRPVGLSKKYFFTKDINGGWRIKIPDVLLPEGVWSKYYTYSGPQFWFFDYSLISSRYLGEYYGPLHLPYSVKYDLFYKIHIQKETFVLFNKYMYYFFSQKIFFIFNLKILWFIFLIGFFLLLWFNLFTSEVMEMSYCFTCCSKIPDMATLKLVNSDRWLNVMVDWSTTDDALERHNFNWLILSNYILPICFVFMFSTFFRLECDYLHLSNWYGYFLWIGCFSTIYWIKICFFGGPAEFMEEAETVITPFKYRQAWAHERKLTHDAEKAYIEKLDAGLEKAGLKKYRSSWIYKRIVKKLHSVKR